MARIPSPANSLSDIVRVCSRWSGDLLAIYLREGQMAAGGGMDGVEGLHPAKAGDAYYFRQNCTVGFYNQNKPDAKAHILALRVYVPLPKELDSPFPFSTGLVSKCSGELTSHWDVLQEIVERVVWASPILRNYV